MVGRYLKNGTFYFVVLAGLFIVPQIAHSYEIPGTDGMTEMQVIATLKQDIALLDEELMTCNRKRKGWVAATVVGGVGVVGTGIAALVQNSNRKEKKAEIAKVQDQIGKTDLQINDAKQQLGQQ